VRYGKARAEGSNGEVRGGDTRGASGEKHRIGQREGEAWSLTQRTGSAYAVHYIVHFHDPQKQLEQVCRQLKLVRV